MISADKKVMVAFCSPEGQIIADFLKRCEEVKVEECLQAEDVQMYRAQGAALELKDVVDLAKTSRDKLNSI